MVNIEDNVVADQSSIYCIQVENIGQQVTILRNYIGTDKTLTKKFQTGGIFAYWASKVAIGSTKPADANYITNCKPVTIWPYTNATVNKNSFFCTIDEYPMHDTDGDDGEFSYPNVSILNSSVKGVSGMATPNSSIELFYSDKCGTCSPQTYFASTTADNTGKWSYNGTITGTVIASATINGNTSEFTRTDIDSTQVTIVNACTVNGLGSIIGAVPESAATIQWVNQAGKVVGNSADLTNVPPGIYKLVVQNGSCSASTPYYQLKATFVIDDSGLIKTNPSCGIANGSVTGVIVIGNETGTIKFEWKDANNKLWSYSPNLTQAPAGTYTLYVANEVNACTTTYGPITLTNTTGPNVDQTNQQIQSTNCGQSTGSITGIVSTGSGTLKYIWWNSQQQTVGTGEDLTGQPAGVYQLEITDDSQCGPVYSSFITIPQTNGITMDESAEVTANAACGNPTGSITGIQVTGATAYLWTDANNKTYTSATADLTNIPPGSYTLTASNIYGCSKISKTYTVIQPPQTQYPAYPVTPVLPCAGQSDGSITISTDLLVKSERWVNSRGQNIGASSTISNISTGTYQLFLTDNNGCEILYGTYSLTDIPPLAIAAQGTPTASTCGLNNGGISGLTITGGATPYTYNWTDATGNNVGTNSNEISNLLSGTYELTITDSRCGNLKVSYTIIDNPVNIPAPSVSNIQLCSSGSALIKVNDPISTATYNLYNSSTSSQPIDQQTGGDFKITATGNTDFYISQINGTCESSRTKVSVSVGLSALSIANTFTPNGDGINDYWQINNIENYPNALVQVFNRYGQKLFESRGYAKPFDGTYNGQKLPSGTYYYIINLSTNCNLLSGSLTIIR